MRTDFFIPFTEKQGNQYYYWSGWWKSLSGNTPCRPDPTSFTMKIKVNFLGMLANYTGVESVDIDLNDDARYDDLLAVIAARFGDKLPQRCWDSDNNEFIKPITAIGTRGDIEERNTPLAGNDEVHILMPISGG
jgi:molybdopterin converting factor small subunit